MMKKIVILGVFLLLGLQGMCACKIQDLGACKANLDNQPQTVKDRLVPNHLNQMMNSTRDSSKEFSNAPHFIPETINVDLDTNQGKNESNTPYNASCQFGVCMPGTNSSSGNVGE